MKRFSLVLALILCLGFSALASANDQIDKSLQYLYSFQDPPSGGLKEENSDVPQDLQSAWGAIAFAAAGFDPKTVQKTDSSPDLFTYALKDICQNTSITDLERGALVVSAAGADPRNINGCSLIDKIKSFEDQSGKIGPNIISTVFGVLALRSSGERIDGKTINYILENQKPDGGWDSGWGTESNITAQTIQALMLSGVAKDASAIVSAKNYLKSLQDEAGGIKYDSSAWTTSSDAFSDAYTLEAIYTLGENPGDAFWQKDGQTVLDDLRDLKNSDGSYSYSFDYGKMNPVWTTSIVLTALSGKPLAFKGEGLKNFRQNTATPTPSPTSTPSSTLAPTTTPALLTTPSPSPSAAVLVQATPEIPPAATQSPQNNPEPAVKGGQEQREKKINWWWLALVAPPSFLSGVWIKWLKLKFLR